MSSRWPLGRIRTHYRAVSSAHRKADNRPREPGVHQTLANENATLSPANRGLSAPARRVAATALLLLIAAASAAAPARAAGPTHPLLFSLTGTEADPGPHHPPDGGFDDACGVAVDSAGDIYVADYYHHAVDVFESSGDYLTQIGGEDPLNGPCNLAVDTSGDLYVNNDHEDVVKFVPSEFPPEPTTTYASATVIDSHNSTGVAVDPLTGRVYVDDRTYVAEFEPTGAPVLSGGNPLRIGLGTLADGYGVAVSDFPTTSGDVYVPDAAENVVKVYDPSGDPLTPTRVIDGSGTPQSGFDDLLDSDITVDQSDGHVYVLDDIQPGFVHPAAVLDEFGLFGNYRGQLPNALTDGEPSGLAVDNSGSPNGGDIYVTSGNDEGASLYAFGPEGRIDIVQVSKSGSGAGTVKSTPPGIECGETCAAEYNLGEAITLTALKDTHSTFTGWTVNGHTSTCPGTGACRVTPQANTEVIAQFTAIPQRSLTVTKSGTGEGTVASAPPGIQCGESCAAEYNLGEAIALTATEDAQSTFTGWIVNGEADVCPGTGACHLDLNADTEVAANFASIPGQALTSVKPDTDESMPSSNRFTIDSVSSSQAGAVAALELTLPGPGALSATGRDIRTATVNAPSAGKVILHLRMTGAGKRALARSRYHQLKSKVAVAFRSTDGGNPAVATKLVTFRAEGKGY